MPQYSYRCKTCSTEFNRVSMIAERLDPEHEPCPECLAEHSVYLAITSTPVIGFNISPSLRTTPNFNDRLKEISKKRGKDCTIDTRSVS